MKNMAAVVEYECSLPFGRQTLTVVSAVRGLPVWAVLECARQAHAEGYRSCRVLRLADVIDRPPTWVCNPMPGLLGEMWMLVVDFEPLNGFGGEG